MSIITVAAVVPVSAVIDDAILSVVVGVVPVSVVVGAFMVSAAVGVALLLSVAVGVVLLSVVVLVSVAAGAVDVVVIAGGGAVVVEDTGSVGSRGDAAVSIRMGDGAIAVVVVRFEAAAAVGEAVSVAMGVVSGVVVAVASVSVAGALAVVLLSLSAEVFSSEPIASCRLRLPDELSLVTVLATSSTEVERFPRPGNASVEPVVESVSVECVVSTEPTERERLSPKPKLEELPCEPNLQTAARAFRRSTGGRKSAGRKNEEEEMVVTFAIQNWSLCTRLLPTANCAPEPPGRYSASPRCRH